ncbi:hypothetical protein B0H63DRAFT_550503 [Podospora didyma]|uniref:Uncharacterized protein n=1 Tax=Podospora didyma TaxID=330526 RepID=A0AAE0K8G7_9PEZI|nr:hypothetical protein B0H63DRAFT_550503 [Podospora didyma]
MLEDHPVGDDHVGTEFRHLRPPNYHTQESTRENSCRLTPCASSTGPLVLRARGMIIIVVVVVLIIIIWPTASDVPAAAAVPVAVAVVVIHDNTWMIQEDSRSDTSDPLAATGPNRLLARSGTMAPFLPALPLEFSFFLSLSAPPGAVVNAQPTPWVSNRAFPQGYEAPFQPAAIEPYRTDRMAPDHEMIWPDGGMSG